MRHRLELAAVYLVRGLIRAMPRGIVRPCGRLLGMTFYLFDGVHRGVADTNLAMAFPQRTPAERRTITREMFGHFGCVLLELLKFSTVRPDECGASSSTRVTTARGGVCAAARACSSLRVILVTGRSTRSCTPSGSSRWRCSPARSTTRSAPAARAGAHVHRQRRHLSAGRGPARAARAEVRARDGLLIDQHVHGPDAIYVELLRAAGGHDVDACGPRAADRVTRRAGLRVARRRAAATVSSTSTRSTRLTPTRPTPFASSRSAAPTCSRCTCGDTRSLWLWMHRRWRDAPLPAATPGMFPPARAEETELRAPRAGAQLARRCHHGASCHCGSPAPFPGATLSLAARRPLAALAAMVPGVDGIMPLEWRRPRTPSRALRRDIDRLREGRFDAALLLPNSFHAALLAYAGADSRALGIPGRPARRRCSRAPCRAAGARLHQAEYYQHLTRRSASPPGRWSPRCG